MLARNLFFVILNAVIISNIFANDRRVKHQTEYPAYGKDWIYIMDADNDLKIIYLTNYKDQKFVGNPDIASSLKFVLYTQTNVNDGQLIDANNLNGFDYDKPTKFITHGWRANGNSSACIDIKDNYLKYYDYNVIIMDWSPISGTIFYPAPMLRTDDVAQHYAEFVNLLIAGGLRPERVHLIGHSLGAHISGFVGDIIGDQKIGRITGLDPAKPGFMSGVLVGIRGRLSKSSAKFVDVIHTCGGVLGLNEPLGHVDFYPNGGVAPQPGCEDLREIAVGCSHARSFMFFAESIVPEAEFVSKKCESFWNSLNRRCTKETTLMGDRVSMDARGTFYLETNAEEPFATYDSSFNNV